MNINWHRLFGLLLMDYLSARGFSVELEKDLSQKRQYLDSIGNPIFLPVILFSY